MKIVLAYHRQRGEGQRTRFISREKAYHGVGFGGMALGGLPNNRRAFGLQLGGVDYLRHTLTCSAMHSAGACRAVALNWPTTGAADRAA